MVTISISIGMKELLTLIIFLFLSDRINFWDFGGHADYDEIRVELYGQTQVRKLVITRAGFLIPVQFSVHRPVSHGQQGF